jgi:hypothetical protein
MIDLLAPATGWVFLAGFLAGVLVVALHGAREGDWRSLNRPRCVEAGENACQAATRRGIVRIRELRWRAHFRCMRCGACWLRRYVYSTAHRLAMLDAMRERVAADTAPAPSTEA